MTKKGRYGVPFVLVKQFTNFSVYDTIVSVKNQTEKYMNEFIDKKVAVFKKFLNSCLEKLPKEMLVRLLFDICFICILNLKKLTEINILDNYAYREYTTIDLLRTKLKSIEKVKGRTGIDARALDDGYKNIELKSGTIKGTTLTMSNFPSMIFDKQNDCARRESIYEYDGFCLSAFTTSSAYPFCSIFVSSSNVEKLHPLFKLKQEEKIKCFNENTQQGKNIGHDAIKVHFKEIVECVGEQNIICWLDKDEVDFSNFLKRIKNKEIKIDEN